jgi:transposase-like protein
MRKSRLSKIEQMRLIEHFVAGTTARCAASLVRVNVDALLLLPSIVCYNISAVRERIWRGLQR